MKIKQLVAHLWSLAKSLFQHSVTEVKDNILPVAVQLTNALKELVTLDSTDFIGHLADKFGGSIWEDKLRKVLPTVLIKLELVSEVVSHTKADGTIDANAVIADFVSKLKLAKSDAQNAWLHSISSLLIVDLSDGKITWSEAVVLGEMFYQHEVKK